MIPILYDSYETEFRTNGLGRLRDCISAVVTEERNSIYELDIEYPVTGRNFDLIQIGRIIGVKHDDSDDIQPFDIVSTTKPLDGVVTVHCNHISYRLSKVVASYYSSIDLDQAIWNLQFNEPHNEFEFWTDKSSEAPFRPDDFVPRTVRSLLGGIEGSILDTYGGEYEWDKFKVKLWNRRGEDAPFTIRYGLNMTEFEDESDSSDCYSAVVPYWSGDVDGVQTVVTGNMVDAGLVTPSGRTECIPMDLSEDFENPPTTAELEASALLKLNSDRPNVLAQSIQVSFIRLQDSNEYQQFQNLLGCKLCDTVNVEFPRYNMSGRFKIVKTVYDVLGERYESMELGKLSTTLSEALGIGSSSGGGGNTASGNDYVEETGVDGIWTYRKWASGISECWGTASWTIASWTAWGSTYYSTYSSAVAFPSGLFLEKPMLTADGQTSTGDTWLASRSGGSKDEAPVHFFMRSSNGTANITGYVNLHAIGRWK